LKRVAPEDFAADLAGDGDDGDGVEHRRRDAGDEVSGAGAGRCDADADFAGGAGVAVGHVRGALLVADEDVVDGELAQGVVGGEDGSARVAEDLVHAFAGEGGPDDFGSGELGVLIFVVPIAHLMSPIIAVAYCTAGLRAFSSGSSFVSAHEI